MALEIGNKVRSVATVAGMALGGLTMSTSAATAQDVQNVLSQTTFSSMQEANSYAQANGMVLARANNGSMMFVTQELADLMVNQ